jgi:CIC family chloride channel protein
MWWPALGVLVVGIGGLICPQALGVGYDQIQALLLGGAGAALTVRLMLVKATIWSVSLGSGTSGGVLAPLLMMGSALGVLESSFLPAHGAGFWPIVSMAAILAGTMRAPLTAMIFAVELSGRFALALPILTAGMVAHLFTVLLLRRSILTEKVARRGFHLSREYAIDPLEILFVREVMLPEGPVPLLVDPAVVAHRDEPLRAAVHRMAESGLTDLPVVDRAEPPNLIGRLTLKEALTARRRHLEEEHRRERVLPLRVMIPFARFRGRYLTRGSVGPISK